MLILFLIAYGTVFSWGDPLTGALGHGDLDYSTKLQGRVAAPTQIESAYAKRSKFIDVACGDNHTALLNGFLLILLIYII